MTGNDRSLRADAARNRSAIIAAATDLFAREGAAISLDRVAEHAGVGSATLYRHFPTRRILLDATVSSTVERLAAVADTEIRTSNDPDALWRWLEHVLRHCATDRAVIDASQATDTAGEDAWAPLLTSGTPLLERARAGGRIDPDVALADILRLVNAVAGATGDDPDEAVRLFQLVRHGLGPT